MSWGSRPVAALRGALEQFRQGHLPKPHALAMVLHVSSGAVVFLITLVTGAEMAHPSAVLVVAALAVLAGGVIALVPWHRWPPARVQVVIPEALCLVVAFNLAAGAPYLYGLFYLVVWTWIGLSQPPGVGLRYAPLLVVAFLAPGVGAFSAPLLVAGACIVPLCVLLAEMIAAVAHRMRQNQADLEHAAFVDPLTGLGNRSDLGRHLADDLRGRPVDALFLDLDGFKVVNDSLGHHVGDLLLQSVTRRIATVAGDQTRVFRVGGDEFVVLVTQTDVGTDRVAGRLVAAFEAPFRVGERELQVGVSIGVTNGGNDPSVDDLLRRADLAMYRAKQAGGRQWVRFDDGMAERARLRLELENDLRLALAGTGELSLEFQPIIEIATGRVVAAEALVRWHHPTMGPLRPDLFVDVAEQSGLIDDLGRLVLHRALQACASWKEQGHHVHVAVNVSPRQFDRPSFVGTVAAALQDSGVPPEALHVEITEGTLLDPEIHETALPMLRELGVGVDIDDFGTGYSSLSYLQRLEVDTLKIDRSFLRPGRGAESSPIVSAIVAMAHALGLAVVAEGVETPEQLALLRHLGADFAQGYLFARPMPPEEFADFLDLALASTSRALQTSELS